MMSQTAILHINFAELCQAANTSEALIIELVKNTILMPIAGNSSSEWMFSASAVNITKKALRLHQQLEIDLEDIRLVMSLLDEIDELKKENAMLKQRLNRFLLDQ